MKMDTVCIIDDDPIYVYGTKILLNYNRNFCSNIVVYEDGQEALVNLSSMVRSGSPYPGVIFLDLNMPIMNGWEFLDEFIKLPFNTKPIVYVVSSTIAEWEIEKAKSYDIVKDFISKPLSFTVLEDLFQNKYL